MSLLLGSYAGLIVNSNENSIDNSSSREVYTQKQKSFEVENTTFIHTYMGVSKNIGTPKSSILIGFSIINHPFSGTPILGNNHIPFFLFSHIFRDFGQVFLDSSMFA